MKIKELEIVTTELLSTLDMKESLNISLDVVRRINEMYSLSTKTLPQLKELRNFIVKYFTKYFNDTKEVTTNDVLVYSTLEYVIDDYMKPLQWVPQFNSKEMLSK